MELYKNYRKLLKSGELKRINFADNSPEKLKEKEIINHIQERVINQFVSENATFDYIEQSPNFFEKFYKYQFIFTKEPDGFNYLYLTSGFKQGKKYVNEFSLDIKFNHYLI